MEALPSDAYQAVEPILTLEETPDGIHLTLNQKGVHADAWKAFQRSLRLRHLRNAPPFSGPSRTGVP
jgi:hypothetical protein